MDQHSAPAAEQDQATPIFGAYRRGYDPEQVDRYVADQQRRLDEATSRASEAERRLAAAVGQLRELHRRVAVLESEDRSPQAAPALDTLGERVQRILQEAWEGAYALRQGAEQEVLDLRTNAQTEADAIVERAQAKADAMEEAIERKRRAFLERIEEDRTRAVAQISYLHEQRKIALGELVKVKDVIEATVGAATDAPSAERSSGLEDAVVRPAAPDTARPAAPETPYPTLTPRREVKETDDALSPAGPATEPTRSIDPEHDVLDEESAWIDERALGELDESAAPSQGEAMPGVFDFEQE